MKTSDDDPTATSGAAAGFDPSVEIRLSAFIRQNIEPITADWVRFAATRTPASNGMTKLALQDHIKEILGFVADDLDTAQSTSEQAAKSQGLGPDGPFGRSAAEIHAALRLNDGFDIDQMISEYRALRASVTRQWTSRHRQLASTDLDDLTRFNEAIDQAMTESVAHYTESVEHSRNLFLGVLGHDLRNPIGAASMTAEAMLRSGNLGQRQTTQAQQIVGTTKRATQILDDLLEITRSAFGMEIPLNRKPMDLGELGHELVQEMRALSADRTIELNVAGDTTGEWDGARIGQIFSNLIGNAIQHSDAAAPIKVSVVGEGPAVVLAVHNTGTSIPPDYLRKIFDTAGSGRNRGLASGSSAHLGLGLFITRKIAMAHGGDVCAASSDTEGTTFSVTLPRSTSWAT